jgi:hypothetical protein
VCHGAIDIFIAPNIHLSSRSPSRRSNNKHTLSTLEKFNYFFLTGTSLFSLPFSVVADVIFLTCHRDVMRGRQPTMGAVGISGLRRVCFSLGELSLIREKV